MPVADRSASSSNTGSDVSLAQVSDIANTETRISIEVILMTLEWRVAVISNCISCRVFGAGACTCTSFYYAARAVYRVLKNVICKDT